MLQAKPRGTVHREYYCRTDIIDRGVCAMKEEIILEFQDVTKKYGEKRALNHFTAKLTPGDRKSVV